MHKFVGAETVSTLLLSVPQIPGIRSNVAVTSLAASIVIEQL
jgi:hypothetical protein